MRLLQSAQNWEVELQAMGLVPVLVDSHLVEQLGWNQKFGVHHPEAGRSEKALNLINATTSKMNPG